MSVRFQTAGLLTVALCQICCAENPASRDDEAVDSANNNGPWTRPAAADGASTAADNPAAADVDAGSGGVSNDAAPVLFFSDIVSGPKTGLGDGLGQGAIVTIWGRYLGGSQGDSTLSCGGVAPAHVYHWENADPEGNSGPADLWSYHGLQEISFSVGSGAADGPGVITVTVDGQTSNALPFVVRSGAIYFVSAEGDDLSGDGSWGSPWRTLEHVGWGADDRLKAGDTVYVVGAFEETDGCSRREGVGMCINYLEGTRDNPFALVAYPGSDVVIQASGGAGIGNWNRDSSYWVFSKLVVKSDGTGINSFEGMRVVANELTDLSCADGMSAALTASRTDAHENTFFGNHVHDFGCATTSKFHHAGYFTNRSGTPVGAPELGWNLFSDNEARGALHVYDEGACGDFTGTLRIHDNVVVNQVAVGLQVTGCFSMDVEIYNNLFVNCGRAQTDGDQASASIAFQGSGNSSNIKFYNNTIYGHSSDGGHVIQVPTSFAGAWEWVNNVIYDTQNTPYSCSGSDCIKPPAAASNNLWYHGGDGDPAAPPSWDSAPVEGDPLFTAPADNNFRPGPGSPLVNAGSSVVGGIVGADLDGRSRPQGGAYDIGAYEQRQP